MKLSFCRRWDGSLRARLMAGTGFGVLCVLPMPPRPVRPWPRRTGASPDHRRKPDYKIDLPSLPKFTVPLVDIPQSINTISSQELKDRAVANFNDAIRTVPGITLGAGEFRSMGNTPSIRGFVARTDIFLDGLRDLSATTIVTLSIFRKSRF